MGPLVPEFCVRLHTSLKPASKPPQKFSFESGQRARKLLDGDFLRGVILPSLVGTSEVHFHDMPDLRSCDANVSDQWKKTQLEVFFIGIPCSPEVFIERAFQVGHPRGFEVHMEPAVHEAINANFAETRAHLQNCVLILLKRWTQRATAKD